MNDKIPLLGIHQSANTFSTWMQGILCKHLFLFCFVFLFICFFFFLVLPGDRGASGSGADLFVLGTVEPIKLKLQTHEFEV